jgi:hypothetical protein
MHGHRRHPSVQEAGCIHYNPRGNARCLAWYAHVGRKLLLNVRCGDFVGLNSFKRSLNRRFNLREAQFRILFYFLV